MIEIGDLLLYEDKRTHTLDYWIVIDFKEKNHIHIDHGFLLFRTSRLKIDSHYIDPDTIYHWIKTFNDNWSVELVKTR